MALAIGIASCNDEELRRVEEPNQAGSCEEASEPPNCKDGYSITVSCGYNDSGTKLVECVDGELVERPCAGTEEPPIMSCPDPVVCDPIPECLESSVERDYRTCGINGDGIRIVERSRDCTDGLWASWTDWAEIIACIDPSYCTDGTAETRSCGINGRGTEIFTCIDGQYDPSGECLDVDICLDESSIDVACGINGRGRTTVTCTDGRLWADICDDIDICRDSEINYELQEVPCGINSRGVQYQERTTSCINGQWGEWGDWSNYGLCFDPDECFDGTERTIVCGLNGDGIQQQTCVEGGFTDDGSCMDDDVCQDGLTITAVNCGYNRRGTTTAMCNEGQLTVGVCDDPDICSIGENRYTPDSCGLNGRGTIEDVCVDSRPGEASLSDDDAFLGASDAPVIMVEFSDYETPFGVRFFNETLPFIKANYIDTGKVKFVYRDFPLNSIHPNAQKAAEAAECAGEQGEYFEMHNKLHMEGVSGGVVSFRTYAEDIGLDITTFNTCLDSGSMTPEINHDLSDGTALGVIGVPSFFINRRLISGAQPYSAFETVIEEALSERSSNWTTWEFSRCIDTDVCVDGTIEEVCCGYDGEGTKTRTCIAGAGQWEEYGDCSVASLVNRTNDSSQDDTNPYVQNINLIFSKRDTFPSRKSDIYLTHIRE
ncbi:thioredoxin domain-containing protein, partial [Candidatus Woesearchaeota archaeon]|nr:thioredoxin domain-containing protein [Candidatus Woesearchaeota archaeon]